MSELRELQDRWKCSTCAEFLWHKTPRGVSESLELLISRNEIEPVGPMLNEIYRFCSPRCLVTFVDTRFRPDVEAEDETER